MKLIFYQSGFVFCLMANADYLERLARHRFGASTDDERYLDKFVDIRLRLEPKPDAIKSAAYELTKELPLAIPYGETEHFSLDAAAELASDLAVLTKFSMRKVKRILLKVEVALRCYSDRPLDVPLLIFMAFRDQAGVTVETSLLPRSFLTPEEAERILETSDGRDVALPRAERQRDSKLNGIVHESAPELLNLPRDRYRLPRALDYKDWALVLQFLAPHYIPEHRDVLDAVASVLAPEDLSSENA